MPVAPICMPVVSPEVVDDDEDGGEIEVKSESGASVGSSNDSNVLGDQSHLPKQQRKKHCLKCDRIVGGVHFARHQRVCDSPVGAACEQAQNNQQLRERNDFLEPQIDKLKVQVKSLKEENNKLKTINELFLKGEVMSRA